MALKNDGFYEEIGKNYRFFLSWRYGVFAAYFVLIWGTFNIVLNGLKISNQISGLILIIASLISVFLWFADCRTRDIYRGLIEKGKELENGKPGAYTVLNKLKFDKFSIFTQSMTIDGIFFITFISFFAFGFILLTTNFIHYNVKNSSFSIKENINCLNLILSVVIPLISFFFLIIYRKLNSNKNKEIKKEKN